MKRCDGIRIKHADPMYTVAAFIMDKRYDSMNMITVDIPVKPMQDYVNEKRGTEKPVTNLALILAAYVRTVSQFPQLNRFIVNKRIYKRTELAVGMVVLRPGDLGNGTMSKMYFKPEYTIFDIQNEISQYVENNRKADYENSTDELISWLSKSPFLCNIFIKLYKALDKHGMLPRKTIDGSPFHASLSISNLASIKTNYIYHHVYEFGTTSVFITLGNQREVPVRKGKEVVFERCLPMGVVMDERICSGSYFAHAFRYMSDLLSNPVLLETPPEKVVPDAD